MKQTPIPCRIEPRKVARIWGRRRLGPIYASSEELAEPVGEVWLSGEDCRFLDGPFAGQPLGEAWRTIPKQWKGARMASEPGFPLLAKFLFPESKLSVQVHPNDNYAKQHEAMSGGRGKTEMWYAVAARPGAEALIGLKDGMNEQSLRQAIADGTLEKHLRHTSVEAGDTIFVPAGTVHTIGPGMVLCEIQEYSDLTYRLFDYNRLGADGKPRELHIEKALDVIDFGQSAAGKTDSVTRQRVAVEVTYLAACSHFATERWRLAESADLPAPRDHFDLLIVLDGTGHVAGEEQRHEYRRGEAWFLPAESADFRLEPAAETTLLRAYVPDLGALRHELEREGVTAGEMAGFFFE